MKLLLALVIAAAAPASGAAQEADRVRLSGYVRDAASGEVLRSARLAVDDAGFLAESNRFGFFQLLLEPGMREITVSSLGYAALTVEMPLLADTTRDFELERRPVRLEDLTVTTDRRPPDVDPEGVQMSTVRLDVPQISRLPVVLGEVDPVRTLTLFPGVSAANDLTAALNVRGGAADENQILLDDSQVFNPAHAIGLFSTFNSDAVGDVTLYKGAIPARYGGRLSSVLEIQQREGNAREFEGSATIGLLASRASVEGPLFGGAGSYLVAGRRTYADLFLALSNDPDLQESTAYFYDLNAKANVRYGATGQVMLSGYFGRDRFKISDVFSAGWGNRAGTLRWNQGFGPVFSHVTLTYGQYDYELLSGFNATAVSWDSSIRNLSLKVDESWAIGRGSLLEFGVALSDVRIAPADIRPAESSAVLPEEFDTREALSPELYVEHEVEVGRLTLRYGARATGFVRRGPETVYEYADGAPLVYDPALGRYEPGVVADSARVEAGETVASFFGIEPRASVRLGLGYATSLKLGYARTRQYLRLVTNTNNTTPLDIWEPVGPWVDPSKADQWSLGLARTFDNGAWGLSAEIYHKRIRDVVDYVDGAQLLLNDRLETTILAGEGRGYGLEILLRKNRGRLRGWAAYTLARSEQRTPGLTAADPGINGGAWYPSPYDRTHDLAVTGTLGLGKDWTFGANLVYATGTPTTYPVSRYEFADLVLAEYGDRNAERLPAYHRLDITFTKRFGRNELRLGVFNVYNRFNAQALAFRQSQESPLVTEAVETSVFGAVPSISYRFFF